ncbi:MAG TPA: FtsQ-type POTRA domain-containing protein [Candidatus Pullichristensenella excrementigallinarum]|uniref:FtsQ-type POTRA domain-containing protein n=1 Tax=Candidatus Pullichristensenella excrementigallinarum TaxID=2840907 RepID=A0A9D1IAK3_9FIRM|nr:FtsQ-type POTRA domain-containing protein [Candidatus Pullichristensenella excrementigallinarum]
MRRRRKALFFVVLAAVLCLAVWLGLENWAFRIRDVQVVGNASVAAEDVIRASKLTLGGKLRSVDQEDVRTAINSTGTLEFVSLKRKYPSTVILEIRERTRDAVVKHAGIVLTLDRDGYVVEKGDSAPDGNWVYVTGLDIGSYHVGEQVAVSKDKLAALRAVIDALDEHQARTYVSELNLENTRSIYLYTRTAMRVDLGDAQNMNNKIMWMTAALQDLEARGQTTGKLDASSGTKADYSPNL